MLYQDQNDETLVMLTLAGEEKAYEALVVRYERAVILSAASVTRNEFMAEDAAQDAFVTAWMKLNTLKEQNKFGAWVCRIAKNCALNMVTRYRSFIPIDVVENQNVGDSGDVNLAELCARSEDQDELRETISKLPEKIRMIIHLHYFEGLSVAEIADRMRISVGTVKWQLHDGRKQIRKELCAMNEKWNDTLVRKVMKKVEELKLWQLKNDKSGFEVVYRDVLRDVEELPESSDKYHALADVLMRGWWWLPGEKNDALFARIKEAAELGKNDEVMEFIVTREDSQVYGGARIDFMREKQIPRLEKAGFVKTLAREWFWLGVLYFQRGNEEQAVEAYEKARQILPSSERYSGFVPSALSILKSYTEKYKEKDKNKYHLVARVDEFRYINARLHHWKGEWFGIGYLQYDRQSNFIFNNAEGHDSSLLCDLGVGESKSADGITRTFVSEMETVTTPAGTFDGCVLYKENKLLENGYHIFNTYYKDGVGIVKQTHTVAGACETKVLSSYDIKGGSGLLPMCYGNVWEYTDEYDPNFISSKLKCTVTYADEEKVIIVSSSEIERFKYDENSWLDMIEKIRNDYCCDHDGGEKICDVYGAIERAEALAKTPMEKAHTKAAASVARRILDTDQEFNPGCKATGYWNFFERNTVVNKNGSISIGGNYRWSFEWKNTGNNLVDEDVLLNNDIYGILNDATKCIWSDEWRIGASPVVEYMLWDTNPIKTQIICEDAGSITVKAGTFDKCIKVSLDIKGQNNGLSYRGGKKEYYFAEGIGIVRFTMEYCGGAKNGSYELTAYEGVGEGYMPIADGFMRRYEAIDLMDGLVGAVEYSYVESDEGELVLFEDRTGIRELPPPISSYGAIQGEIEEENAWDIKNPKEGHLLHSVNNLKLMIHYLARPTHHARNAKRSIEICRFNMNMMESFGNGTVPDAWCAMYAWTSLVQSAAYFGNKEKEEGYNALERATEYYEKSNKFAKDDLLDTGNEEVFGGIKLIRGKSTILLPDGRKEPIAYGYRIDDSYEKRLYQILTRPQGWEWFNSVRNEERFKEYIERARALGENQDHR